jgi:hypothetical protein
VPCRTASAPPWCPPRAGSTWTGTATSTAPLLFSEKLAGLTHMNPQYLKDVGWDVIGGKMLCPRHLRALEIQAEAMLDGLPFEEVPA